MAAIAIPFIFTNGLIDWAKMTRVEIKPGVIYFPALLNREEQESLRDEIYAAIKAAHLFQSTMPRWGNPMSVKMLNLGSLGWVSDKSGYRYQKTHPVTGEAWPPLFPSLLKIWDRLTNNYAEPEACLINYYSATAKMGLHQDRDEEDFNAPVVSLSLGDTALFRIGTSERNGSTQSIKLQSGDGLIFGGPARLDFHGIDRIYKDTSTLLNEGGRFNLTMRRVTKPVIAAP
jgi:alkylated DNA repair protein (DNA oxidative demethylase)